MSVRIVAVLLFAAFTTCANAQRLPSNVHPVHYSLHLTPDLVSATFTGDERIDVILDAPSKTITLNALELTISSVSSNNQSAQVDYDPVKEQATFTFATGLPAGKSTLAISYKGILNDKLRGFYLSRTHDTKDSSGKLKSKGRSYAVTQFESTDARRAFPSFDEPALKATFDISVTADKNDVVISNGPQIKDDKQGDKHTVTFGTTPKMSTYLVAFLVGDFKCSKGKSDGTPIRVCSTPDKEKLTKFALEEAKNTLHFYNDYFGIPYPMAKLDMVAIPDFEAGAMENFGCITYRETGLLVDEKGSIDAKKNVLVDVTHEMAHQWFGDMVTMQWWDNLWLNEGFATWMEGKAARHLHPEWGFAQDIASTLDGVMSQDSRVTTRTIRATAETPAQINEMFDSITYEKGGAVIGMVEHFIGAEAFRQGVHNYLSAHLYANATAEDFWNAQTANSHQPVDKIMSSFIDQPGVPMVKISSAGNGVLNVAQVRLFASEPAGDAPNSHNWMLPLCFKTSANPKCVLVTPESSSLAVPTDAASPLYVNAADQGYFRTGYAPEQTAAIIASIETKFTPEERIGFVGDRWALMQAGQGSVGDYLDLVLALKDDPDANVLDVALGKVQAISQRIATPEDAKRLHAIIRKQFGPIYTAMGGHDKKDTPDRMERRGLLFNVLGDAQDPAVLQEAVKITTELFSGKDPSDPALADAAVALTAKNGTKEFYEVMQRVSQNTSNPSLQAETLTMLGNFEDPELVKRTLDYIVSGAVRNQDSWVVLAALLRHPYSRAQAWDYVRANWDKVHAQLTASSGAGFVGATGSFCTVEQRDQAREFFAAHPVENTERTVKESFDASTDCIKLRQTQQPNLKAWLDAHQ